MLAHSKCICNDPPTEGTVSWKRLKQHLKAAGFGKEVRQIVCQRQGVRIGKCVACVCVYIIHTRAH